MKLSLISSLASSQACKGEDLLLQAPSEDVQRYHRLRASIPSNLWRWKTVCGWRWSGSAEHINVLEMRAVLTALKWRFARKGWIRTRFLHLVDSQVCLHALARGRSSSRKLRRTLLRINSLLLASCWHLARMECGRMFTLNSTQPTVRVGARSRKNG